MTTKMITYEQPLNELIRICLRLEHLFHLITYHTNRPEAEHSRCAITALLDVLSVVERPDIKTKLVKALSRHAERLTQLEHSKAVDQDKLAEILAQLDDLIDVMQSSPGRLAQSLKDNEFLAMVRTRLSIPAGDCDFNLPCYQRWLAAPAEQRINDLMGWMEAYTHLRSATNFLLMLTRQSAAPTPMQIEGGFHQQTMDANVSWQLIRIALPHEANVYPEFSVGRHRLSLRINELNPQGRPTQHNQVIQCQLTLCSG